MVAPVEFKPKVAFRFTVPPYGRTVLFRAIDGYVQKKPYTVDTPTIIITQRGDGNKSADQWDWSFSNPRWNNFPRVKTATYNLAYKRLVGQLGEASSFGATLTAERKETFSMVVSIITRAALAARSIKRWDFGGAARLLGIPYRERTVRTRRFIHRKDGSIRRTVVSRKRVMTLPTGREVQKTLANGWLMYSYGIQPLMGDIYNGMDVLQRPLPFQRVRSGTVTGTDKNGWFNTGVYVSTKTRQMKIECRCSAFVQVNNPNLWLANRLGLVNPIAWINEAIPFSFVVDWFSNLSDVIGASTDFVGLTVSRPTITTVFTQIEDTFGSGPYGRDPYSTHIESVTFVRELGLKTPELQFAFERFGWQRGLNAISLLTQFLPRKSG